MLLVTVSDDRFGRKGGLYEETQNKIKIIFENNTFFGIDNFQMWNWKDIIKTDFYKENKLLLDHSDPSKNGRVYKPFVIYEGLNSIEYGEFLIYTDCSPEIWTFSSDYKIDKNIFKPEILKNLCLNNNGILTAHVKWDDRIHVPKGERGYHTHENFTSERCINRMGMREYKYSLQHASGMFVIQKTPDTLEFVKEWLYWNSIDECASLGPVNTQDCSYWAEESITHGKVGHRHDQSISGLLINKRNNKLIETSESYERPLSGIHPYNFLQFSSNKFNYTFLDSNPLPSSLMHRNVYKDGIWQVIVTNRN